MILSFDISTSCTGISILSLKNELVFYKAVKLLKQKCLFDKRNEILKLVQIIQEQYEITHICIEDVLQKFSYGGSRASVIVLLARFNGMVSDMLYSQFNIKPEHLSFKEARKHMGIKVPSYKNVKSKYRKKRAKKKFIVECVKKQYPNLDIDLNRNKDVADHMFDIVDSIVIANYCFSML